MDDDYAVDGNQLTVTKFSITKGVFNVRAIDRYAKYCDIEVIVTSHNVALIAAIAVCVGLALAGLVLLITVYRRSLIPFRGDVTVYSSVNGAYRGRTITGRRGRIKLTSFGLDPINGIDYRKARVQATAKPFVTFKTKTPVMFAGKQVKEVRVENGRKTIVYSPDGSGSLELSFKSIMDPVTFGGPRGKGGFKPPRQPKAPKVPKPPKAPKLGRR
jgi:hypothetical protein